MQWSRKQVQASSCSFSRPNNGSSPPAVAYCGEAACHAWDTTGLTGEADSFSVSEEVFCILCNPTVHYCFHNSIKMYRTVTLPVVLYGCETWSLTLKEEHRLRVFTNKVLRRIFGPKMDKVTGDWRRLHKEELYAPYSSPSIF